MSVTVRRSRQWLRGSSRSGVGSMSWSRMQAAVVVDRRIPGPAPRSGALTTDGNELVRDRVLMQRGCPSDEATAFRKDHHGKFGRGHSTIRRWRLCPLRGHESRYRPLHEVSGAGSRAFGITANCIAPGVIATGQNMSNRQIRVPFSGKQVSPRQHTHTKQSERFTPPDAERSQRGGWRPWQLRRAASWRSKR
jgi:hypothetical protein